MQVTVKALVDVAFGKAGEELTGFKELVIESYYPSQIDPRVKLFVPGGTIIIDAADLIKAVERASVRTV